MSTQNDYHRCLEKLTAAPPKRKAALVRSLLPSIEAALSSGQTLKDIWQALEVEGLPVSYHTFQMAVWRAKRKRTAASNWEKREKPSGARRIEAAGLRVAEERDPLANLRRLEEIRPGFQWRGTQKCKKWSREKSARMAKADGNGSSSTSMPSAGSSNSPRLREKNLVIWLNEYFGPVLQDGAPFREMPVCKKHASKVYGSVAIVRRTADTFGRDVEEMIRQKPLLARVLK